MGDVYDDQAQAVFDNWLKSKHEQYSFDLVADFAAALRTAAAQATEAERERKQDDYDEIILALREFIEWGAMTNSDRDYFFFKFSKFVADADRAAAIRAPRPSAAPDAEP